MTEDHYIGTAFADEAITVSTTAIGITEATADTELAHSAKAAKITIDLADIRYRLSGDAATATVGHLLYDGETLTIIGIGNLKNLSMYRDAATDAEVHITYYR